jgi:hypothetical protein
MTQLFCILQIDTFEMMFASEVTAPITEFYQRALPGIFEGEGSSQGGGIG